MKNKKIIIFAITLFLLVVLGLLMHKVLFKERSKVLNNINYKIVNKKVLGLTSDDEWVLVEKKGYDYQTDEYKITSDDKIIASINENLVKRMKGYETGYIEGFYNKDNFYTSVITDNNLVIKNLDLDSNTYEKYISSSMPNGYKCSSSTCLATILYKNDNYIYINAVTLDNNYYDTFYSVDLNTQTVTKLNSSLRNQIFDPTTYIYNDNLIIRANYGLYLINTKDNTFETIHDIDTDTSKLIEDIISVKNNELHYTYNGKDYKYNLNK